MVKKAAAIKEVLTTSYKGVRDFYPEDMYFEKYMFAAMRHTAENFGYVEYGASILEPAELYQAKTGEEIVNEQTYTFTDRGGREVTLRPEMTPTVARMIAAKRRELSFPLRWYSIPNLFRYEQPQRGRLREHFQLNLDIFGVESERADIEVVSVAYQLLKNLGAEDADFEIKISDRNLLNYFWDSISLPISKRRKIEKIIDKKAKMPDEEFRKNIEAEAGKRAAKIIEALDSGHAFMEAIGSAESPEIAKRLINIVDGLSKLGVTNVIFCPTLVRGFDYYSGFIFEIFDKDPSNSRSLFGGGRYDNLLKIFGAELVPAVGFGVGDVTLLDFLSTHKLLPEYRSSTFLCLAVLDDEYEFADILAEKIRDSGVSVAIDYSEKSIGDKIKKASTDKIPYFAVIGSTEVKSRTIKVKKLEDRSETSFPINEAGLHALTDYIFKI